MMVALAFRNQPLKTLYYVYAIAATLARLPIWTLTSLFSPPRPTWSLRRALALRLMTAYIRFVFAIGAFGPGVDTWPGAADGFVWVDGVSADMVCGDIEELARTNGVRPARVHGYWYGKRGKDGEWGQIARGDERVLYHLHGGGYIASSGSPDALGAPIVTGILTHCAGVVDRAFCIDYRLSSAAPFRAANPFPAALLDALAGYIYLIRTTHTNPANIILSGDSAGGHLALALARYLDQARLPGLPVPGALLLQSPTADWACTHDAARGSSMSVNYATDYVAPFLQSGYTARALRGALQPRAVAENVWLSPASLALSEESVEGKFKGMPPTRLVAGGAEQTLDGVRTLWKRMVRDNGDQKVKYVEYEDATHEWLALPWFEPERSRALNDLREWILEVM